MSQPDNTTLASAINLAEITAHPAEAMAALIEVVQRQGELLREHEMRLDKHSKHIDDLRYKEDPEPTKTQAEYGLMLRALLASREGKMLEKDARNILHLDRAVFSRLLKSQRDFIDTKPLHEDKRQNVLILRSKIS